MDVLAIHESNVLKQLSCFSESTCCFARSTTSEFDFDGIFGFRDSSLLKEGLVSGSFGDHQLCTVTRSETKLVNGST